MAKISEGKGARLLPFEANDGVIGLLDRGRRHRLTADVLPLRAAARAADLQDALGAVSVDSVDDDEAASAMFTPMAGMTILLQSSIPLIDPEDRRCGNEALS
jgi:hypothetical protein